MDRSRFQASFSLPELNRLVQKASHAQIAKVEASKALHRNSADHSPALACPALPTNLTTNFTTAENSSCACSHRKARSSEAELKDSVLDSGAVITLIRIILIIIPMGILYGRTLVMRSPIITAPRIHGIAHGPRIAISAITKATRTIQKASESAR